MIQLLYGKDDYRIREMVRRIRDEIAAGDPMFDVASVVALDGATLTPGELVAAAMTLPFMAAHRLVVVEGLIQAVQASLGRKKKDIEEVVAPWREAAPALAGAPPSTTLVFVEGDVSPRGAVFGVVAAVADVREVGPPRPEELAPWIDEKAREKGVRLAPRAVAALTQLIGADLWALENELDKLAAYAGGEVVDPDMIGRVVSAAKEARVWDMTDAIVAGDAAKALTAMRALLAAGDAAPMLAFMVARQFRQLAVVKDMRERGARQDEVARASGVPSFRLSVVGSLASQFSWDVLGRIYARMLDADLNVKRGLQDDETSLQLLVEDLARMAPPSGRARPALRGGQTRSYSR